MSSGHPNTACPARPKLLLLDFWGIGDLTLATTILPAALAKYDVTIAAKPTASPLLGPSFPTINFLPFDPPWTAFRGKYHLWRWAWGKLLSFIAELRRQRFDIAVSVRHDPRDHLLMVLAGVRERIGFPAHGSAPLLTHVVNRSSDKSHKVEDWREIGIALGLEGMEQAVPALDANAYRSGLIGHALAHARKPLVVLHPGARIAVRRWPQEYFLEIVKRLRSEFDFDLAVVLEPDGYGHQLVSEAQVVIPSLQLGELVDLLSRADLVLCNDSGPGHIAAACQTPSCVVFGPGDPDCFRPWGDIHHVAVRDLCTYRPCFDYCRFPEPYCLTRLTPDVIWPELRTYIFAMLQRGVLRPDFALK
ncbi:glycosyltransferase family 9 protein [Verrucomicrobiota bacterium sgz303538]